MDCGEETTSPKKTLPETNTDNRAYQTGGRIPFIQTITAGASGHEIEHLSEEAIGKMVSSSLHGGKTEVTMMAVSQTQGEVTGTMVPANSQGEARWTMVPTQPLGGATGTTVPVHPIGGALETIVPAQPQGGTTLVQVQKQRIDNVSLSVSGGEANVFGDNNTIIINKNDDETKALLMDVKEMVYNQTKKTQKTSQKTSATQTSGPSQAKQPRIEDPDQQQSTDPEAMIVTTQDTSQARKIHPDLEPMIEKPKARIQKDKAEKKFYATKGFLDAKDTLKKNRVVVIKGNTGDGKTAIAVQLLHWLSQEEGTGQPLQLHEIKKLDLLAPNRKLITFIDNIFGERDVCQSEVQEWEKRISDVETCFVDKQTNFLVITIRNEVFNYSKTHSLGTIFTIDNIVDLSSHTYQITEEKKELIKMYTPEHCSWTEEETTHISGFAPNIGFPQCCQLFYNSKELQKERVAFFGNPFHFLKEALLKLRECSALLYLFFNGGMIKVKDLDPNSKNVDGKKLEEAFEINLTDGEDDSTKLTYKKKVGFVKENLEKLLDVFVVKEKQFWTDGDEVYRFNHNSIYFAVAVLYGKVTPIGFIQNCPSKSLSYITTSETGPNRVVISSDHYKEMCERLLKEFECEKHYYDVSIGSLDVWNDAVFVKRFVELLSDRKVDKPAALNAACRYRATECVVYLLSEGVKPNKDTAVSLVSLHRHANNTLVCLLENMFDYLNDETKLDVLNAACCYWAEECVLYLLSKGVKPNNSSVLWRLISRIQKNDGNRHVCLLEKIVVYLNDETKLGVMNEACLEGSEECVLYLLGEGVKPDKNTLWDVVEGRNEKFLRKILQYKITPTAMYSNQNVLHRGCGWQRGDIMTLLCDTYPHLVHDTEWMRQTPLHFAAHTGNCSVFQTVERCVLNSLYRVEDQQHKCETVDGRTVHRNCVCAQYMTMLVCKEGQTVLHKSFWDIRNREVSLYICQSYPSLSTAVDKDGRYCLHYIAGLWRSNELDWFTECETLVKQYLENTGCKYDITNIVDKDGKTVLHKSCFGNREVCAGRTRHLLQLLIRTAGIVYIILLGQSGQM